MYLYQKTNVCNMEDFSWNAKNPYEFFFNIPPVDVIGYLTLEYTHIFSFIYKWPE